jgi:hypothetical protein
MPRRGCTPFSSGLSQICLGQRRLDAIKAGSTVPLVLHGAAELYVMKTGSTVLVLLHGAVNLDAINTGSIVSRHAGLEGDQRGWL